MDNLIFCNVSFDIIGPYALQYIVTSDLPGNDVNWVLEYQAGSSLWEWYFNCVLLKYLSQILISN